jgi:hypothetical protein
MKKNIIGIMIVLLSVNYLWAIETNHKVSIGANYLSGDLKADNGYEIDYSYWLGGDFKVGVGASYLMVDTQSDIDKEDTEDTFMVDFRAGAYVFSDLLVYVNYGAGISKTNYKKSGSNDYEVADGSVLGINSQLDINENLNFTLSFKYYDLEYEKDNSKGEFDIKSLGLSIGYQF